MKVLDKIDLFMLSENAESTDTESEPNKVDEDNKEEMTELITLLKESVKSEE